MTHRHQPFASVAVATLRNLRVGDDTREYLERMDETLRPFGGRFVVHGGEPLAVEGAVEFGLVVIGFPEPDGALRWYESEAYQPLIPMRQGFSEGTFTLYPGQPDEHQATDIL